MVSSQKKGGFSIIELLISISIFTIRTAIVIVDYPKFSSGLVVETVAQEIALTIRTAQSYGLSVKSAAVFNPNVTPRTFGVHFRTTTAGNASDLSDKKTILIFQDDVCGGAPLYPPDGIYTASSPCGTSEKVETSRIQTQESITKLCLGLLSPGGGGNPDSPTGSAVCTTKGTDYLDITFTRPDPKGTIAASFAGGSFFGDAEVIITNPKGGRKMVVFWETGQIYVQNI